MAKTVQLTSLPWKQCEIDGALELRSAIVGDAASGAAELAKINIELERSNNELDAFAYIASMTWKSPYEEFTTSSFLIEDYADVLNVEGVSKLQTMMRLQRMEDLIESLLHFFSSGTGGTLDAEDQPERIVKNVIDVLSISLKDTR